MERWKWLRQWSLESKVLGTSRRQPTTHQMSGVAGRACHCRTQENSRIPERCRKLSSALFSACFWLIAKSNVSGLWPLGLQKKCVWHGKMKPFAASEKEGWENQRQQDSAKPHTIPYYYKSPIEPAGCSTVILRCSARQLTPIALKCWPRHAIRWLISGTTKYTSL